MVSVTSFLDLILFNNSPGVIKTEIQKRGGMSEEEYQKVR